MNMNYAVAVDARHPYGPEQWGSAVLSAHLYKVISDEGAWWSRTKHAIFALAAGALQPWQTFGALHDVCWHGEGSAGQIAIPARILWQRTKYFRRSSSGAALFALRAAPRKIASASLTPLRAIAMVSRSYCLGTPCSDNSNRFELLAMCRTAYLMASSCLVAESWQNQA